MTGGGTGGHLVIIKAVKEKLPYEDLIYIGSKNGQDKKWFENDGDFRDRYFLNTTGVVNKTIFSKLISLFQIALATREVIKIFKKNDVGVVFSVGGYSSAPAGFAAKALKIPLIIHEQNAFIGKINQILLPYAKYFISSYTENSPIKAYPTKDDFFQKQRTRKDVNCIIFLGGSQGAVAINELALEIAPKLKARDIKIIHQAGENNIDFVTKEYQKLGIDAKVFGFTDRLSSHMNEADLAISRSGASTLWEVGANALPTIFIPYPHAAGNHQYHNAKFFLDKEVSWVMPQDDIDIDKILSILDEDLSHKSIKLMGIVEKYASIKIANLLKEENKS
jgi:UDP-N-acetylglucosamine--N-acetylmuramyl-(pentapeptide) pyrophosphoryl-undecaprenol N-acetylglucosamine transferase